MKKFMMMAMMLVASATAFAGDSDALKAILKAKDYAEAEALLKSSLGQLANDQEKAKAYNKLVDLAYAKYKKEDDTRITNQALMKNDPVDTDGMIKAGIDALNYGLECDKFDVLPNAKGQVKPAFQKKNQDRLYNVLKGLYDNGCNFAENGKNEEAFKCLDAYVNGSTASLFKENPAVKNDPNRGIAAYYAGRAAMQLEKKERAIELLKMGVADTMKQVREYSIDLLLFTMSKNRSTKADSLKFINDMKDLYAQYPENEKVYSYMCDALILNNDEAAVEEIAKNHLAKFPNSVLPHIYSAFLLQNQKKYAEAVAEWNKVPESQPNYVQFAYYRAVCKYNIAAEFNEKNSDERTGRLTPENDKKFKELLTDAQVDFEKCQELDPEQNTVKWKYLLHNVYTQTGQQAKADALD
ncbi:MAG: hypothetical protein J6W43_07510 [Prevotella sp.]|nr:hypothetical protein [Prevotella sp.]